MNAVKIGSAYIPVQTIEEAVTLWEDLRDTYSMTPHNMPSVTACVERRLYRIAHDGTVTDAANGKAVDVGPRVTKSPDGAIASCVD